MAKKQQKNEISDDGISPTSSYPLPNPSVSFITAAVSLSVYLNSICPTIAGGDAGELVAEGCQLGTAHPPGYPLFTIITYVLKGAFGEFARPAFIMNCFSATCGAIQAGIVTYLTMILLPTLDDIPKKAIGLASGLGSAFSPLAWQYHITAEVRQSEGWEERSDDRILLQHNN